MLLAIPNGLPKRLHHVSSQHRKRKGACPILQPLQLRLSNLNVFNLKDENDSVLICICLRLKLIPFSYVY
jgi:hypothetical protein